MELINNTNYPAMMFRTVLPQDNMATSVIMKVTYDIGPDKTIPSEDQKWLLHKAPWESEYGPIEGDNSLKLGGVDILIFGKARSMNNQPVTQMNVSVKLANKLSHKLTVFGNRVWEKGLLGMAPSKPEAFTEMPMTLYNAYGGKAEWDGLIMPYGNNPHGKGYYWEKENAVNNPLPNIEDPANLLSKWDHRPDPVGIVSCPMNELRVRGNIEFSEAGQIKKIGARFYNTAFPSMIVPEVKAGEKIIIDGMTRSGSYSFEIPEHTLMTKITIGDKVNERKLIIDQVGIEPDKNQAFITYRFPFRYKFEPLQVRQCEIFNTN